MSAVLAMALKDLRLLLRDRAGFFFTLFFPLIVAIFYGAIFSGGGERRSAIRILLVDEDGTDISRNFISVLDSSAELEVLTAERERAVELVRKGKNAAFVVLKQGFGEAYQRMFWGTPPTVEIGSDPSRRAEAAMLEGILMKYGSERFQKMFSDTAAQRGQLGQMKEQLKGSSHMPPAIRDNLERILGGWEGLLAQTPGESAGRTQGGSGHYSLEPLRIEQTNVVVVREGPRNPYEITFPQGIIWGMIGITAAFGLSLVTERTRGTLIRVQTAPVSRVQILAGKALACFMTTTVVSCGLLIIGMLFFGIRPASIWMMGLAILSSSIAFVGIMMFISVLGKTEHSAAGMTWAVLLIMSMVGGGMLPLFFMPAWLQRLSHISPMKWSILAMEGAIWRHFSFVEVARPCLILIAVGVIFFAIGVRSFRWSEQ